LIVNRFNVLIGFDLSIDLCINMDRTGGVVNDT